MASQCHQCEVLLGPNLNKLPNGLRAHYHSKHALQTAGQTPPPKPSRSLSAVSQVGR